MSKSCDCHWAGGFIKFKELLRQETDEVVVAKVKVDSLFDFYGQTPARMRVSIEKVYQGKIASDYAIIIGDEGASCSVSLEEFVAWKDWIAILYPYDTQENKYELIACGASYLKVEGDEVIGIVANNDSRTPERMALIDLESKLTSSQGSSWMIVALILLAIAFIILLLKKVRRQ